MLGRVLEYLAVSLDFTAPKRVAVTMKNSTNGIRGDQG